MEGNDVEMELEEEPVLTDQEALQGLETVIGWLEAQQDVEQVKIVRLVSLNSMILKKRFSHKNNKLLTF
jgi:CII-binding regulator of phage lambda lysogenization HflD